MSQNKWAECIFYEHFYFSVCVVFLYLVNKNYHAESPCCLGAIQVLRNAYGGGGGVCV